jgi:hypothetical protein
VLARLFAEYQPERLGEAIRLTESIVVAEPTFPHARNRVWHMLLAWHLRLGDAKGAATAMERGFANDPAGLVKELLRLSPLEEGVSETEKGARAAAAQHAVDLWLGKTDPLPDQLRVSFKLLGGEVLAARKSYSDSVRQLRQLREEAPRDPRVTAALGRVLFLAGEYRDSLEEWNRLVIGLPKKGSEDCLVAVVEACRCSLELGARAGAERLLKIVETSHSGKGSEAVRRRLADLKKRVER